MQQRQCFRSSQQMRSIKKGVLKILTISQRNICLRITLLKKRRWYRFFPVDFNSFLTTHFLENTSGQLLLVFWKLFVITEKDQHTMLQMHFKIKWDLSCFKKNFWYAFYRIPSPRISSSDLCKTFQSNSASVTASGYTLDLLCRSCYVFFSLHILIVAVVEPVNKRFDDWF